MGVVYLWREHVLKERLPERLVAIERRVEASAWKYQRNKPASVNVACAIGLRRARRGGRTIRDPC